MSWDNKELESMHAGNQNKDKNEINEELVEKRIRQQTEKIEVPESLCPESIEKLLQEKKQESEKTGKKQVRRKYGYTVAVVVCCALAVGVAVWSRSGHSEEKTVQTADMAGNSEKQKTENSENGSAAADSSERCAETKIASAKDYDEIYQYLREESEGNNIGGSAGNVTESIQDSGNRGLASSDHAAAAGASSAEKAVLGSESASAAGYSDTNVREDGVSEGDVVKTDGKYLYILNNQKVQIVSIEQEEMEQLGTVRLDDDQYISEIYVQDGKLLIVYTKTEYNDGGDGYGGMYKQYTVAETYDVSNPKKPESLGKVTQSGDFYTMRVRGEYVYLLSNFYADMSAGKNDTDAYIPQVQGKALASDSIYMPQYKRGSQYTVISSFSLKNPDKKAESKAIFGCSGMVYVSKDSIYVCEAVFDSKESDVTQTCIRKMTYEDGSLEAVGQTKVDGTLNDSFSIDEYEGNLRIVTTVSTAGNSGVTPIIRFGDANGIQEAGQEDSNALYVLDKNLKMIGQIEGLAKDEQIYSARFMGEVGYFVTYKQVDPLFSVDLSNPEKPEVTGTLKITGFSEYLHPFGDGLLLGIGMDVDETGTATNGVKLSMFDVSNPEGAEEIQKYVLEDCYSTDISHNYKAAFIDIKKQLIGFSGYGQGQHYYIFTYGDAGFQCIFDRELSGYSEARGLYAGDTFYLVSGNTVESYAPGNWEKLDDIVL